MRRAVTHANVGKLRYWTAAEQVLWSECNRLLANCIIDDNAVIPARILEAKRAAGDTVGAEQLTQAAPIAWQHSNFAGRYEFTTRVAFIALERVVDDMIYRMYLIHSPSPPVRCVGSDGGSPSACC